MSYQIAIDGPAGAGKSTIAKLLAEELDFRYVDTGAMYRSIAVCCIDGGISPEDEDAVKALCENTEIKVQFLDGTQHMLADGTDVTGRLREEQTGNIASVISVYACVRDKLLSMQREIAEQENVIMDGRDIGSVVLPDADVKIYLSASAVARAMRRYSELEEKGVESDLEQIIADIKARDYRDMNREIAPLKKADGAVLVDSSNMTIPQVVDACKTIIAEHSDIPGVR